MLSEKALSDIVLSSIKSKIASVISLDDILNTIDAQSAGQKIADGLAAQVAENEQRLEKIRRFKASLHESMIDGDISKEEMRSYKARYDADADELMCANQKLEQEIEDALACKTERLQWLAHFKQFENLETINRRVVSTLIKSIRVVSKRELVISYNYQKEYDAAVQIGTSGLCADERKVG
jgi:hypothetical protein